MMWGLAILRSGQPATTLSGGEAQRVKLATELSRTANRQNDLYSRRADNGIAYCGCAPPDRRLAKLVDAGNSVVVIEHNLDLIKTADYIIDLGPEGGDEGGQIVATGTPEQVAKVEKSYTGQYLKKYLSSI